MAESSPGLRRELRLWHVVLFDISALAGLRWLAAAAHAGPGSITLWLLAALLFFLPCALVVSSLTERFPEEGGLYIWTKRAFGAWHGFICAWFYFLGNIIYFPTLLLSGVAMAGYLFGSGGLQYSESRLFAIPATLVALWVAFLAHLVGLRVGKWTSILGGGSSYLIAALLVVFGLLALWRYGSATQFRLVPEVSFENLNLWSQIAFAMVGLEVAPILGGEIHNPRRTIQQAAWLSGIGSVIFYVAGTSALLVLLPPARISVLTGLAQAGEIAGVRFNASWLPRCIAALFTVGVVGQLSTYAAGNTRLPFALGLDHHFPPALARLHPRWHTPHVSILAQAILSSAFLIVMQLGENLRAAYQILVDITVITTLIPFVYIFASGFRFHQRWAGASGALVSALAILISASPPTGIASVWLFELKIVGGTVLLTLAGHLIFVRSTLRAR